MSDGVSPSEVLLTSDNLDGTITDGRNGGRRMRGRLAGGVRDKLTMGEMKARMASLWKDGETYLEIANKVSDEFGLVGDERFKANGIHYHMKNLLEYWRSVGLLHIDERQAMILARYDQLEMLCMEAYFASCTGTLTSNYEKQVEKARSKEREAQLREIIAEERERKKGSMNPNHRDNPMFQFDLSDGELADILVITSEKVKEYTRTEENLAGDSKWVRLMIDINDKRAKLWGLLNRKGPDSDDAAMAKLSDEQRDERLAAVLSSALHRRAKGAGDTNLAPPAPLGGWENQEEIPESAKVVVVPDEPETVPEEEDEGFGFGDEEFWK